jgi:hypothetical protein
MLAIGVYVYTLLPVCWLCLPVQLLASNVLNPASIDVRLDDIGGLENVKEEMVRHNRGWVCVCGGGSYVGSSTSLCRLT